VKKQSAATLKGLLHGWKFPLRERKGQAWPDLLQFLFSHINTNFIPGISLRAQKGTLIQVNQPIIVFQSSMHVISPRLRHAEHGAAKLTYSPSAHPKKNGAAAFKAGFSGLLLG
jgi:hypothetical protein